MTDIAKAKQQRMSSTISDPPKFPSDAPQSRPTSTVQPPTDTTPASESPMASPEPAAKPAVIAAKEPEQVAPLRKSPSLHSPPTAPKPEIKSTAAGKHDFRANLKPRALPRDQSKNAEPEFKNALGSLRRTQAEKIAIPDVFKDNIVRGKNALNITGGVPKRERVDELKESLIKRKEEMKTKAASAPCRPH